MAKVFIGMLAYNGERFIGEAIESLLAQSFPDFTLFISDDASTDGTQKICEKYAKKDPRVIYHRQQKNIGMFPNFKFVLDKAQGEYFMWASHDDIWEKDFIKVCVENMENKKVSAAMTVIANVDSYGRSVRELTEMTKLSGRPGIRHVSEYILQPEILGKGNLMYSLFKMDVIKKVWEIYPQRMEWGSDYIFSLALISHFSIFVDEKTLFKKRLGGHSSKGLTKDDRLDRVKRIVISDPRNHIFPFGRFSKYLNGHMEALQGTPYRPLVALLLFFRLPRSFLIYLKERNYKKFFNRTN
ncbi:MAG: Glycosyltransferase [Parcubacteria group bacterium GW2011_GWA1_47_8]|nr:MAG: Glycosyltransferase [Parcubacteria group bacterium GW2011_GWA1_47_8]